MDSGSVCSWNSFTVVHLNITKKSLKKEVKQRIRQCDACNGGTVAELSTPRARKYSLNENGVLCTHGWLDPVSYLLWIRSYKITSVSNSVSFRSALFLDPAGWAVSDGSQKNLPKAEAHVQVRYGKDVLGDHDIGTMRLHRGWLWMVSI